MCLLIFRLGNLLHHDPIVMRALAIFAFGLMLGITGMLMYRPQSARTSVHLDESKQKAEVGVAPRTSRRLVMALGTLEPRDGVVRISSALTGYLINNVAVQDGQVVEQGTLLLELDGRPAATEHALAKSQRAEAIERQQAEVDVAKRRVAAAELGLVHAKEGRALELDAQKSQIAVAAAKNKQTANDLQRLEGLRRLPDPLASDQQIEQQRLLHDNSLAERTAAEATLKRREQALDFQQQSAEAELAAAKQALAIAEKGTGIESLDRHIELADLKLKQTKIVAPTSGVVLDVQAHPGEVIATQPLLQIADLDNLICVAEVDAGDVPYLRADQKAIVSCRAFQDVKLNGVVKRIGNQVAGAMLRPLDPRGSADRNVTKVIVAIDAQQATRLMNASGRDQRIALVGMQVEVTFPLAEKP